MVFYNEDLIEEIRSSNDIVDVISQYVVLKRSGRNFFGLCPFHKEKSPSFSVSPDKQIFHCFGCGVGGNVIHFISKIENIDFKETLEFLAERAGIPLPDNNSYEDNKKQNIKSNIYKINEYTAKFFHENLYKPTSKQAQEYIKFRKLDNKTLKSFLIGYSTTYNELYKALIKEGFKEEDILASGLVSKTDEGTYIDRFRKRLMFPIQDVKGKVIAFGGRVLDDSKPKYINSSENLVYSKGRNLYGLNVAKQNKLDEIIIVEGYMDAVSLFQRGITNVVASLGTALTEAQGRLLRKYSQKIVIGYDSDGAGQAATIRGLEILQNLGCDVRVLQIEGAKDPDEFVVKYGSGRFNIIVEKAISLIEFKIKILSKDLDLENINDKIRFLNEIAKVLASVDNEIEKEIYIDKISNEYKISKEAIYAEVNKQSEKINNVNSNILEKRTIIKAKKQDDSMPKEDLKRENMIISLIINNNAYGRIKDIIKPEDLKLVQNQKILRKLYEEFQKGDSNSNNVLNLFEDQDLINHLTEILAGDYEIINVDKAIEDIINKYKEEKLRNKKEEIMEKINNKTISPEEKTELLKEVMNINRELKKL